MAVPSPPLPPQQSSFKLLFLVLVINSLFLIFASPSFDFISFLFYVWVFNLKVIFAIFIYLCPFCLIILDSAWPWYTKYIGWVWGLLLTVIMGPLYVSVSAVEFWGNFLGFSNVLELSQEIVHSLRFISVPISERSRSCQMLVYWCFWYSFM